MMSLFEIITTFVLCLSSRMANVTFLAIKCYVEIKKKLNRVSVNANTVYDCSVVGKHSVLLCSRNIDSDCVRRGRVNISVSIEFHNRE